MNNYFDIQIIIYMYNIIFKGGDLELYIGVGLGANLKQLPDPFLCPKKLLAKPSLFHNISDKGVAPLSWR